MGEQEQRKWQGETKVEIKGFTPTQVWPLISDFHSLNKWFPHVKTCYLLEGEPGEVGTIRYCADMEVPSEDTLWVKEKLTMIDSSKMCFSYEIVDNNSGFTTYLSTFQLSPVEGEDGGEGGHGCRIVWSFVADPVDGYTFEGLVGFLDGTAKAMGKRLEDALLNSSQVL